MWDKELSQQIEELIEIDDMEVEVGPQNQDVNLMPSTKQVAIQIAPPPTIELAPRKEEEVVPLDDDLVMDTYNFSYGEHKRINCTSAKEIFFRMTSHLLHLLEKW